MAYICDHKGHDKDKPETAYRLIHGTITTPTGTIHSFDAHSCANTGHVADIVGRNIPSLGRGSKMVITIETL